MIEPLNPRHPLSSSFFLTCNPHFYPLVHCILVFCLLLGTSTCNNSVQHTLFRMSSYIELHGWVFQTTLSPDPSKPCFGTLRFRSLRTHPRCWRRNSDGVGRELSSDHTSWSEPQRPGRHPPHLLLTYTSALLPYNILSWARIKGDIRLPWSEGRKAPGDPQREDCCPKIWGPPTNGSYVNYRSPSLFLFLVSTFPAFTNRLRYKHNFPHISNNVKSSKPLDCEPS